MRAEGETFRLLQPGLMSIDELKELISQRGVNIKGNEYKTKHQLVELYERLLQPLSQRKFPNPGQGQIINTKIAEEDKKRAGKEPKASNDFQYGFKEKASGSSPKRHSNYRSSTSSSDRLKPPVDSSSVQPKKICLSRRSTDKDLDKIVINDRSKKNSESSSEKSGRERSLKSDKQEADKRSPVKTHSSTHKELNEKEKEEPDPKRRKIAWP